MAAVISTERTPEEAVAAVAVAVAARSGSLVEAAYRDLVAVPKSELAESSARIGPWLAGLLGQMPPWYGAVYAVVVGALVEWNADAVECAPAVLGGLDRSLRQAIEFVPLWRERFGEEEDLPDPTGLPDGQVQERLGSDSSSEWYNPYIGWHTVHKWERAAVAVLADPRVRRHADLTRLVELAKALDPDYGDLQCALRALLLLDDEPLLVMDRASGKAFRMRMSGISGNYQLQTLLAGVLVGGGHLPGQAPSPEAVAISSTAEIDMDRLGDLPLATECFNFAEPSGRWIWGEATPSRIPVVDGIRQLVLDPPVYRHVYRAIRFLPRVRASVELEAVLDPAEAAPYFAKVRPLMPPDDTGRLAADGY